MRFLLAWFLATSLKLNSLDCVCLLDTCKGAKSLKIEVCASLFSEHAITIFGTGNCCNEMYVAGSGQVQKQQWPQMANPRKNVGGHLMQSWHAGQDQRLLLHQPFSGTV